MALEPIRLHKYEEPDRAKAQAAVVAAVQSDPEKLFRRYEADPRSYQGRYVSADLFKEIFAVYTQSQTSRSHYNGAVHNSAAVLSSEQFRRAVERGHPGDAAIFLTGIPGAGKTSTLLASNGLNQDVAVVFEGQLSTPATGIEKISLALNKGLRPTIIAVHNTPEQALESSIRRYEIKGRGAGLGVMADIQARLPGGLERIREIYGDQVRLLVRDQRARANPQSYEGWQHINLLRTEGNHEDIRRKLETHLARLHADGRISDSAFQQAAGREPPENIATNVRHDGQEHAQAGDGRGIPQGHRAVSLVGR